MQISRLYAFMNFFIVSTFELNQMDSVMQQCLLDPH